MSAARAATAHAGHHYRKLFARLRPSGTLEAEREHLRQVEQVGESGRTPFIAMLGLFLFLFPIFLFLVGIAFGAYYLAR